MTVTAARAARRESYACYMYYALCRVMFGIDCPARGGCDRYLVGGAPLYLPFA